MTATTADGVFILFSSSTSDSLSLMIGCVGYTTKKLALNIVHGKQEYDLGPIVFSSGIAISKVTVMGNKPLVSLNDGKIVYHVSADPDAKRSQLVDILRKVPLLSVSGLDQVTMNGSTNYKVLVNGRRSAMYAKNFKQVIQAVPAEVVESIEVIENPSGKYDTENAEGVINIIMKKNTQHFIGTLAGAVDSYPSYMESGYFALGRNKFNTAATLMHKNVIFPYTYFSSHNEILSNGIQRLSKGHNDPDKRSYDLTANIEASYDIDKYNLLSLNVYNYLFNAHEAPQSKFLEYDNQDTLKAYYSIGYDNAKRTDWEINLDYQHLFKKRSQFLTISYRYTKGVRDNDNTYTYDGIINYDDYGRQKLYIRKENEHIFQLDYFDPIGKKLSFEIGIKYNLRFNTNNTDLYHLLPEGGWLFDTDYKDNLDYTQHVIAGYVGLN